MPGIVTRERDGQATCPFLGRLGCWCLSATRLVASSRCSCGETAMRTARANLTCRAARPAVQGPAHRCTSPRGRRQPTVWCATEGALKADVAFARTGLPTVGLPGVGISRSLLPILRELSARTVRLAVDADAADKPSVARPWQVSPRAMQAEGLTVELERWPTPHKGIDDAIVAGATIEVVRGDDACRAIAETVAEGTAGEPVPAPSPLDGLPEVLAEGGPEAVFRNGEMLRALARLAEADPAEYACRRAQLAGAGVKLRTWTGHSLRSAVSLRAAQPPPDVAGAYRVSGGRIVRDNLTKDGIVEVPLSTWAGRVVEEVVHDDGVERSVTLAIEGAYKMGYRLPVSRCPPTNGPSCAGRSSSGAREPWSLPGWDG